MPFLKKITGNNNITHSRSTSSSSLKAGSQESPNSSSNNKHTSWRSPVTGKKKGASDYKTSNSSSRSLCGNKQSVDYGDQNGGGCEELEDTSPYPWAAGANSAPWNERGISDMRKISDDNSNGVHYDKLILSWDPTDPEEWSSQRVTSWLRFHDFPEMWINLFKKYQLSGQRFIRLLAYDNFAFYERYLPQTKNASYSRFQYLLKRTMEKNVINNHIRQRSEGVDKAKDSRYSSENLKCRSKTNKGQEDSNSLRSTSESSLSTNKSSPAKPQEDSGSKIIHHDKTDRSAKGVHQKTKSAGSLYRRSLISLRGVSSGDDTSRLSSKPTSDIKLNIPTGLHSDGESRSDSAKSVSPSSPPYPGVFKHHEKSSSSESSLLNTLFGSAYSNAVTEEHPEKGLRSQIRTSSNESLPRSKVYLHETNSSSPLKQSPMVLEEKNSIWSKWKRKSQNGMTGNNSPQSSISRPAKNSSADTSVFIRSDNSRAYGSITSEQSKSPSFAGTAKDEVQRREQQRGTKESGKQNSISTSNYLLDKKYCPLRSRDNVSKIYILITRDNECFIPLDLSVIASLDDFKDSITLLLGIGHKDISIHMTDFGCEVGSALPDDVLEALKSNFFLNTAGKLFVKDLSKKRKKTLAMTGSHDLERAANVKPRSSSKSIGSGVTTSADDISVVTSSFDVSVHGCQNLKSTSGFPKTPSMYYNGGYVSGATPSAIVHDKVSSGERVNYVKSKTPAMDPNGQTCGPLLSSHNNGSSLSNKNMKGTFQILHKDLGNEIDFDKRRESPYVQPELAPKREAPKPPTNGSPQRSKSHSISSQVSSSHLKNDRYKTSQWKKARPPPSILSGPSEEVHSSDAIVNSYTPGSSHVLVPQPYKGANEPPRKVRTEEDQPETAIPPTFMARQRLGFSDSIAPTGASPHCNSSPLLKRGISSKRIISSASAADVFEENDVTFVGAPELSDSDDSSNESSFSDAIIWAGGKKQDSEDFQKTAVNSESSLGRDAESGSFKTEDTSLASSLERKMTLRPSPEVVYQNLEKFFPRANLDKPVLEGVTPPPSPRSDDLSHHSSGPIGLNPMSHKIMENQGTQAATNLGSVSNTKQPDKQKETKFPRRAKTIRTIAHEASEKRKQSIKLKRKNTKMWGTRTIEVTDKRLVSINKAKNAKGEYKEFAWIKGEMIGKGSFGAVFLCLNVTTGEMMAVKQVEVPIYGSQNEAIMSTVEALRAEVSTLKDLDHLNIVQYLGFEVKDSIYSLFLEYVAGGSVGSLIRMYGKFDEKLIQHLTIQVLRGLSFLHSRGILHRDMKADNLLLDQDGVCKISDFGISRKSKDIYSNSEMTMRGTVFWMAPEMVDTKQGYSAKVDIWSLGCVLLEMFAGKRPWSNLEVVAAMFKIGKSKSAPPIPDDTLPLISQNGREFLDQCFKIDPEKRPTAGELLSHPFLNTDSKYDFKSTKLAEFIKSNDKLNSSKLRIGSQDKIQLELNPIT